MGNLEHGLGETNAERAGEWSGHAPSLEDLRGLRLSALLKDVMDGLGLVKAAETLGVDRKTLWRCRSTGRLTPRLSEALERLLLSRDLSSAMRQGERIDGLERRVEQLAGDLRGGLDVVEADVAVLREEHARSMRHVERRLVRLEEGRSAQDAPEAPRNSSAPRPEGRRVAPWRLYRELVTEEAEPDEELVYGEATPVIVAWREARADSLKAMKTATTLERMEMRERVLGLEVAIIEEHGLTLPPARYPWDGSKRRDEVWERRASLRSVRHERERALRRRWLRRVLTLGLWWE